MPIFQYSEEKLIAQFKISGMDNCVEVVFIFIKVFVPYGSCADSTYFDLQIGSVSSFLKNPDMHNLFFTSFFLHLMCVLAGSCFNTDDTIKHAITRWLTT